MERRCTRTGLWAVGSLCSAVNEEEIRNYASGLNSASLSKCWTLWRSCRKRSVVPFAVRLTSFYRRSSGEDCCWIRLVFWSQAVSLDTAKLVFDLMDLSAVESLQGTFRSRMTIMLGIPDGSKPPYAFFSHLFFPCWQILSFLTSCKIVLT